MTSKTLLFAFVIILGLFAENVGAADAPDGFAGIPWGTSRDEAVQEMLKKPGVTKMSGDTPGRESFIGGTFADYPVRVWGLEFTSDGKLSRGAVVIKATADRDGGFTAVKRLITQKYGVANSNSKRGNEAKAIWRGGKDKKTIIELETNSGGGGPKLTYRNDSLEAAKPGSKKDI